MLSQTLNDSPSVSSAGSSPTESPPRPNTSVDDRFPPHPAAIRERANKNHLNFINRNLPLDSQYKKRQRMRYSTHAPAVKTPPCWALLPKNVVESASRRREIYAVHEGTGLFGAVFPVHAGIFPLD